MKPASPWITYRTRFLVKAKQLTTSLAFTDDLGRLHSGRKGDYLVESSDGVLSIAPRQIFEDVYVALQSNQHENSANELSPSRSVIPTVPPPSRRDAEAEWRDLLSQPRPNLLAAPLTRKSPQPYRDRRTTSASVRFI